MCSGKSAVCGSLCLDHSGSEMLSRLGNCVYEACRSQKLTLSGFPDFSPTVSALKSGPSQDRSKTYRVSCQVHDNLVVLQSFAQRWLEHEHLKDRATRLIEEHNEEYNASGSFWATDMTAYAKNTWGKLFQRFLSNILSFFTIV